MCLTVYLISLSAGVIEWLLLLLDVLVLSCYLTLYEHMKTAEQYGDWYTGH